MRILYPVAFILILFPFMAIGSCHMLDTEINVGIVTVDEVDDGILAIILEGLNDDGTGFKAIVTGSNISSSGVREEDGFLLISDLMKKLERDVHNDHDVLLLVTNHSIRDWDEEGKALWGQAHPHRQSAIMTTKYWENETDIYSLRIKQVAKHELYHLLGYPHNLLDRSGTMQYVAAMGNDDLCPAYGFQLPLRILSFPLYQGLTFRWTMVVTGVIISSLILPAYIGIEIGLNDLRKRSENIKDPSSFLSPGILLVSFIFLIPFNGAFYAFFIPIIFSIYIHAMDHFLQRIIPLREG